MTRRPIHPEPALSAGSNPSPIVVDGTSFAINGANSSYRFHADPDTGDLTSDHFGGPVTENPIAEIRANGGGWSTVEHLRREWPDLGRGDFRTPAVHIKHAEGYTVTDFRYESHTIVKGKPDLPGLPSTFGSENEVTTLIIHMRDNLSSIKADLSYSIFPKYDALARSIKITNQGSTDISIEKLASFSVDLPYEEYEMLQLHGEWTRECTRIRRKVDYGVQGYGSASGFSSFYHNPFLALVSPSTTESQGKVWGFSLVYTGSFNVEVEKTPQGFTRALIGMNSIHMSWPLKPGESFTSPECISVFSSFGIGDMSRKFHRLYRQNLILSPFVNKPRPTLLNSWEGLYFNYDEEKIYKMAQDSAALGVKLFVLDDGWFGVKYPRLNDRAALGDWDPNPVRFPNGLGALADRIKQLKAANVSGGHVPTENLQFGLWFEPEMVNVKSSLYEEHPDWVLSAGKYPRTEARNQLVLDLAIPEVQEFVIDSVSKILSTVAVSYLKWDANRAIHESPSPQNNHAYVLGFYRICKELTTRFPHVLWEGCASGGARFDPGILQYFPQVWTSDNTDALSRIHIQFGTSLVYPPSTMGAHISDVPNHYTRRTIPMRFRAHVAMMGGSFGLELNPSAITPEDKAQLPELISLAEKIAPIVIGGDLWRINLPEESNYPAAMFISEDGSHAVLFYFQIRETSVHNFPLLYLQGLDEKAFYKIDGEGAYSGATLMNGGIQQRFKGDYDSRIMFIEKL